MQNYPEDYMTGSFWSPNDEEKRAVLGYLQESASELDKELVPYLTRLVGSKILPVYSCWGHPEEDEQSRGYLLFRADFSPDELIKDVSAPLQTLLWHQYRLQVGFSTSLWHTIGIDRMGYIFEWDCSLSDEYKHVIMDYMCQAVGR